MKNVFWQSPADGLLNDLDKQTQETRQIIEAESQKLPDISNEPVQSVNGTPLTPANSPLTAGGATPSEVAPTKIKRIKGDLLPPPELRPVFEKASQKYQVPINVLMALAHQESEYNDKAVGPITKWGKAKGMMQYLDMTAKERGIDPFNPDQAIDAAAQDIKKRLDNGYSMEDAIKAHFGGDGRKQWGPKTRAYGEEVTNKAVELAKKLQAQQTPLPGQKAKATPEEIAQAQSGDEDWDKEAAAAQKRLDDAPYWDRAGDAIAKGWDNTLKSLSVSQLVLSGKDPEALAKLLEQKMIEQNKAQDKKTTGQREIDNSIKGISEAKGAWDTVKASAGAVGAMASNPKDFSINIIEQLPNTLPSLATGAAGAGAGAGVGLLGGLPGAVGGAVWGGRAGMVAGTTATEFGAEIEQIVSERLNAQDKKPSAENIKAVISDKAFMEEAQARALKKGLTVGIVDQLFLKLSGSIARTPVRAAEKKALQTLSAQGVNTSTEAAARAALKSEAGKAALKAARLPLATRAGYATGAIGVDAVGEGAGEGASQAVARGTVDKGEVFAEAAYGLGQSVVDPSIGAAIEGIKSSYGALGSRTSPPPGPPPPPNTTPPPGPTASGGGAPTPPDSGTPAPSAPSGPLSNALNALKDPGILDQGMLADSLNQGIADGTIISEGGENATPVKTTEENTPTPDVPEGMVRMYHGGTDTRDTGGSRWFSRSLDYAKGYAAKTTDGEVFYVDIPADSPLVTEDEYGVLPQHNLELPEEISINRKKYVESGEGQLNEQKSEEVQPEAAPEQAAGESAEAQKPAQAGGTASDVRGNAEKVDRHIRIAKKGTVRAIFSSKPEAKAYDMASRLAVADITGNPDVIAEAWLKKTKYDKKDVEQWRSGVMSLVKNAKDNKVKIGGIPLPKAKVKADASAEIKAPSPVAVPANQFGSLPAGKKSGDVVSIQNKQFSLTEEQATAWNEAQAEHDSKVAFHRRNSSHDKEQALKNIKGAGMELSAKRRQIVGELTDKERKAKEEEAAAIKKGDRVTALVKGEKVTGTAKVVAYGRIWIDTGGERSVSANRADVQKITEEDGDGTSTNQSYTPTGEAVTAQQPATENTQPAELLHAPDTGNDNDGANDGATNKAGRAPRKPRVARKDNSLAAESVTPKDKRADADTGGSGSSATTGDNRKANGKNRNAPSDGSAVNQQDQLAGKIPHLTNDGPNKQNQFEVDAKNKVIDYMNGDISKDDLKKHLAEDDRLKTGHINAFLNRLTDEQFNGGDVQEIFARKEALKGGAVKAPSAKPSSGEKKQGPAPAPVSNSGFGTKNKLYAKEDMEAALREIENSFKGAQLNSGLDPKILALGMRVAGYYIEGGIRSFPEFALKMSEVIKQPVSSLKGYLRLWYNDVKEELLDNDLDASGMDSPESIRAWLKNYKEGDEAPQEPPAAPKTKRKTETVLTPAGRELEVEYKVVEAGSLVTSNDDTGGINRKYPQHLQPRDRTRGASELQINDIASNLKPALLARNPSTSDGAPIVSSEGIVESGNGRTLAIRRAYKRGMKSAENYREFLQSEGYDIEGMKQPVLVRERVTPMTTEELVEYTGESNERTTLSLSATERAMSDAKGMAEIIHGYRGGDISSAANRDFVRKFIDEVVAKSDRTSMMDMHGILSQEGRRRIEASMLATAYGSADIVSEVFESTYTDIKNIGNALLDASGAWAQMVQKAQDGRVAKELDVTSHSHLIEAVNIIRKARAEGRSVLDLVRQADIFTGETDPLTEGFVKLFYRGDSFSRARSREKVADALKNYAHIAQTSLSEDNLFGEAATNPQDIIRNVNERIEREELNSPQADLFSGFAGDGANLGQPGGGGQGSLTGAPRQKNAEAKPEEKVSETLADHLYNLISSGGLPKDNNALRKVIIEFDGKDVDNSRLKEAQEDLEAALVRRARDIVKEGKGTEETFQSLLALYEGQPNLNIRTSTSVENQAYSTPAPLAYLASELAGINSKSKVYEPTAGNGMLLIAATPKNATANELESQRYENLKALGFDAIQGDALQAIESGVIVEKSQDAVITNPPFGSVKDAAGKAVKVPVDGFKIGKIDHLIAAEALRALKDDGRATLIIGADKSTGGLSTDDRIFFNWLYGRYNVTSHFEVDGKLYMRQGAAWPVRVITINGRQASSQVSPAPGTIQRVKTWGDVYEQFKQGVVDTQKPNDGNTESNTVSKGKDESADDTRASSNAPSGENKGNDSKGRGARSKKADGGVERTGTGTVDDGAVQPGSGLANANSDERGNGSAIKTDQLGEGSEAGRVSSESARSDKPGGTTGKSRVTEPSVQENQFQSSYVARSDRKDEGVLIPVNMSQPTQDGLNKLEDEVGSIDAYAIEQLGYKNKEELHNALMGLQVDSVASAIYQTSKGKGIIIADQTGIGKGRQAAAVIRWAVKHGHIPIFFTVKPQLFTDMYGDLADIGSHDVAPFIMNVDSHISSAEGDKLFSNKAKDHKKVLGEIASTGQLPDGRNALFVTYSQINTSNTQRLAILALADRAIFILDESHNAGGQSETGEFIKSALGLAKGVTYLSATYAKRPDNMPVYFKTDIGEAIGDDSSLMDAMNFGGLPLQTVVSNNLVKAGQMFRRERSYDGVSIETKVDTARTKEHEDLSNRVTEALRAITAADKSFHTHYVKAMQEELKKQGAALRDDMGNKSSASVDHTQFSSVVHNFVRQMLLGLKADAAADDAIAAIKANEKPIIAVDNTMGSFLNEYSQSNNIKKGDSLGRFDYRTILNRALERSRYIKYQHPTGEEERIFVTLDKLDPITRDAYAKAAAIIEGLDLDIPVSPIDWMRYRIQKAGYSVAEITGRNLAVDYTGESPLLDMVPTQEQNDKVGTTRRFNSGELDALILNVAGSTGISLHASEKFKDKRQRHMIVGQAAQDINIFMQMLGRIHRTGQVTLPKYTILNVDLPAEKRPTALLSKKMKSLNANTSSNTESATSIKAPDMLNKYGDQIIGQYLTDNLELARALGFDGGTNDEGEADDGIATKATGRLALMPVATQKQFYNEVEEQYSALIDYLNKTNQNELEPRTLDFDAKETLTDILHEGDNHDSPFGQDAIYGEYSIKAQGKAMTPEEIKEEINESLKGKSRIDYMEEIIDPLQEELKKYIGGFKDPGLGDEARAIGNKTSSFLYERYIGSKWHIQIGGEIYNSIVTGIKNNHKGSGNPFSMSKFQISLAVNGSLRHITVPASQFSRIEVAMISPNISVDDLFKAKPANERETAKIVTGNLLAAYGQLQGTRGTIVNFTRSDGSVDQGILLPKNFTLSKNTRGDLRIKTAEDVLKYLTTSRNEDVRRFGVSGRDGNVRVIPSHRDIEIVVPKSKARGGKYFLDKTLLSVTGDFVSHGQMMRVTVPKEKAVSAINVLLNKGALYVNPSMAQNAREVLGYEKSIPEKSNNLLNQASEPELKSEESATQKAEREVIPHTTGKGNVIRGVVMKDMTREEAQAIDEYTFKKDGGWFIREKHLDKLPPVGEGVNFSVSDEGEGSGMEDITAALGEHKELGEFADTLIDEGKVIVHETAEDLLELIGGVKNPSGFTGPDGKIHLIAQQLTPETAMPVLLHEMFHAGVKRLIGAQAWAGAMKQLGTLYRQGGNASPVVTAARKRVADAKARGAITEENEVEEFGAYLIEEYEKLPKAYASWVDKAIGTVKAWVLERFGKQLGKITPAQLRALAAQALRIGSNRQGLNMPQKTTPFQKLQNIFQDNESRVKQAQKTIERLTGQAIKEISDFYGALERKPGRVAARFEDVRDNLMGGILKDLGRAGYKKEQLIELLHADHAEERNEHLVTIRQADGSYKEDGSGMSTQTAREIQEKYKSDFKLHDFAERVREIARETLLLRLEYGLIDQETYDFLSNYYKNYVPLKGDQGASTKMYRATGHNKRDEMMLENIVRDFEQVVQAGERNAAIQYLFNLINDFPDPATWTISVLPQGKKIVGYAGFVVKYGDKKVRVLETEAEAHDFIQRDMEVNGTKFEDYEVTDGRGEKIKMFNRPMQDNELVFYIKGKALRIQLNDKVLASQLKRMTPSRIKSAMNMLHSFMNYLKSIYTAYSPDFIAYNTLRDVFTGTINMTGNQGARIAAKAWGNYPSAMRALWQFSRGKTIANPHMKMRLQGYRSQGGKTGASWASDLERNVKTLESIYEDAYGPLKLARDGRNGRAAAVAFRKTLRAVAGIVQSVNQATENALRLSLYTAMMDEKNKDNEAVFSSGQAASAAKNVTVNFDRKGAYTAEMGALYIFFNPAVQGGANAIKTLTQGKHKWQAWALLGGLTALGSLTSILGNGDDEDRWLGESWETKTKNALFYVGGHQVKIPLSQEYSPIFALGVAIGDVMYGGESKAKAATRVLSSFLGAFLPFRGLYNAENDDHLSDMAMAIVPTLLQPLYAIATNKSSFGGQLYPENENTKVVPDNLKMFRGTRGSAYDEVAQFIAKAGENKYENDISKISPETLEYLWGTFTGGFGKFVTDSGGAMAMTVTEPEAMTSSHIPIVKRFYKEKGNAPLRSRFYELSREASSMASQFKLAKKLDDDAELDKLSSDTEKERLSSLADNMKAYAKLAAQKRDDIIEINADTTMTSAEKRATIRELEKEEEQAYRDGIEAFKN